MAANLANRIQEKVKALPPEKQQQVLSMVEEMLSEKKTNEGRELRPIWEIADEISSQVPLEEWKRLPSDGAEQHDHYLYGSPKK